MSKFQVTLRQYVYYEITVEAADAASAITSVEARIRDDDDVDVEMVEYDNGDLEVVHATNETGKIVDNPNYR